MVAKDNSFVKRIENIKKLSMMPVFLDTVRENNIICDKNVYWVISNKSIIEIL